MTSIRDRACPAIRCARAPRDTATQGRTPKGTGSKGLSMVDGKDRSNPKRLAKLFSAAQCKKSCGQTSNALIPIALCCGFRSKSPTRSTGSLETSRAPGAAPGSQAWTRCWSGAPVLPLHVFWVRVRLPPLVQSARVSLAFKPPERRNGMPTIREQHLGLSPPGRPERRWSLTIHETEPCASTPEERSPVRATREFQMQEVIYERGGYRRKRF